MNKLPPELRIVSPSTNAVRIDAMADRIAESIPEAEWMDNPDAWDKKKFVAESAEFMFLVYGIGTEQDRHTLAMLADQIDAYIVCNRGLATDGFITDYNGGKTVGPSPWFAMRKECLKAIISLMNELGLTPKGRLAKTKTLDNSTAQKLMRGPKG